MDTFFLSLSRANDLHATTEERSSRRRIFRLSGLDDMVLLLHGSNRGSVLRHLSNPLDSTGKRISASTETRPRFGGSCPGFRAAILDPLLSCDSWSSSRLPWRR